MDENEPVFKKILAQITEKDIKRILPQQGKKNINEGVLQKNDKKATKNLAK